MAYNVDQLKTALGIGAKKYKFKLTLPIAGAENADLLCKSASLPQVEISETAVFTKGRKLKIRGIKKYEGELKCVFLSDDLHTLRRAFEAQLSKTDSFNTNISSVNHADYMITGMKLTQLDGNDAEKASWEFYNVWLKSVDQVDFTSGEDEELVETGAVFSYSHYERIL